MHNVNTHYTNQGKELAKRYILFIISLFFSALGVAITKKGARRIYRFF